MSVSTETDSIISSVIPSGTMQIDGSGINSDNIVITIRTNDKPNAGSSSSELECQGDASNRHVRGDGRGDDDQHTSIV